MRDHEVGGKAGDRFLRGGLERIGGGRFMRFSTRVRGSATECFRGNVGQRWLGVVRASLCVEASEESVTETTGWQKKQRTIQGTRSLSPTSTTRDGR